MKILIIKKDNIGMKSKRKITEPRNGTESEGRREIPPINVHLLVLTLILSLIFLLAILVF